MTGFTLTMSALMTLNALYLLYKNLKSSSFTQWLFPALVSLAFATWGYLTLLRGVC